MRAAALLVALLGAAATAWGHSSRSDAAFYAGVMLLIAALGPLAFAAVGCCLNIFWNFLGKSRRRNTKKRQTCQTKGNKKPR